MGKQLLLIVLGTICSMATYAQKNVKTLKEVMTLKVDREGGANGANVAWHPIQKKYYAAMAGNASYPMMVFDAKGKKLNPDNLTTMFDVRGLWYDPFVNKLRENGYDNNGWAEYRIDEDGIPVSSAKLSIVASQPNVQSVGAFDHKKNELYFLDYDLVELERHSMMGDGGTKNIKIYLGAQNNADATMKVNDELKADYNENAIIYVGQPGADIGLLNVEKKQVELYSVVSGYMMQVWKLPEGAPVQSSLNFSYCNGICWLFDKETRVWHGYK